MNFYDKVILGAGIYGLYAAHVCASRGENVLILENDSEACMRATYINQARVHMGYHYPRSISTAEKSARYFERFCEDFGFCIRKSFDQIYATSAKLSWTNANAFQKFCDNASIPCKRINELDYFRPGLCDGAFLTKEYTYDAQVLKRHFLDELGACKNMTIKYKQKIIHINEAEEKWIIETETEKYETKFLINATYAGINEIQQIVGFEPFKIKYELCEIILCSVSDNLKNVGLTVMDGPFFSLMPFGKTDLHSLTSVTFTPHITSYDTTATFKCQDRSNGLCSPQNLYNCNSCSTRPESAWPYMSQLARKYMNPDLKFKYEYSLFSMKPILKTSEIDDSRPTMVKMEKENPTFVSVFSGKINTIYDLDEVLNNE